MRKERALQVILWLVLTAVAAYTLFPLLFLLINAFKSQSEIIADPMKMPANWDFNYIFEAVKKTGFCECLCYNVCNYILLGTIDCSVGSIVGMDDGAQQHTPVKDSVFNVYSSYAGAVSSYYVSADGGI